MNPWRIEKLFKLLPVLRLFASSLKSAVELSQDNNIYAYICGCPDCIKRRQVLSLECGIGISVNKDSFHIFSDAAFNVIDLRYNQLKNKVNI